MNTFPNIIPTTIAEFFVKRQTRTPFDDGSVQSRVRHTRGRSKWQLDFTTLNVSEINEIKTFFYANQGDLFYWTHPMTLVQYEARFSEDEIQVEYQSPTNCSTTISIEEA